MAVVSESLSSARLLATKTPISQVKSSFHILLTEKVDNLLQVLTVQFQTDHLKTKKFLDEKRQKREEEKQKLEAETKLFQDHLGTDINWSFAADLKPAGMAWQLLDGWILYVQFKGRILGARGTFPRAIAF